MNSGAVRSINTGSKLNGRALTVAGALNTSAICAMANTTNCGQTGTSSGEKATNLTFVGSNPFNESITISMNDAYYENGAELRIYNSLGELILKSAVTKQKTTISANGLPLGIYIYKMSNKSGNFQTGKIISQ